MYDSHTADRTARLFHEKIKVRGETARLSLAVALRKTGETGGMVGVNFATSLATSAQTVVRMLTHPSTW
jgi:hypothetical protein